MFALTTLGCERRSEETHDLSEATDFAELLKQFDDEFSSYSEKDQVPDDVFQRLITAASQEVRGSFVDGESAIISQFPDHQLSGYLVENAFERLKSNSLPDAMQYLEEIYKAYPEQSIGKIALEHHLNSLKETSETEFLGQCAEILQIYPDTKLPQVALAMRLIYYNSRNEPSLSALDALQLGSFSGGLPIELPMELTGYLRHSGLTLEAEVLEIVDSPHVLFKYLFDSFSVISQPQDSATNHRTPSEHYLVHNNDRSRWEITSADIHPELEDIITLLRQASVSLSKRDMEQLITDLNLHNQLFPAMRGNKSLQGTPLEFIASSQLILLEQIGKYLADDSLSQQYFGPALWGKLKAPLLSIVRKLNYFYVESAVHSSKYDNAELNEIYNDIFVPQIEYHEKIGDRRGVMELYEKYLEDYENSSIIPKLLIDFGDYQAETIRSQAKAIELYQRVQAEFSPSEESIVAELKIILLYFQDKRFDFVYALAEDFEKKYPNESRLPMVMYMGGISQVSLGLPNEGIERLERLVKMYPGSDLAPQALSWLAHFFMSQENYTAADRYFKDVLVQYPETREASEAMQIRNSLATLL